ncbi:hypothetical protein [Actinomadura opuntiae]|uniref:hypothetical protein n=1 Tax=Actinomadura sp. OS1-43 TaxID=604315 RepID=UPI00255AF601|nr:hypothetical protein [Actinomadura sp. OS1-43]MDL4815680.1 hypothetical protein [Actinomadura sp. OS1-43]
MTSTAAARTAFRPAVAAPAAMVAGVVHPDIWWTVASGVAGSRLYALDGKGRTRAAYTLTGVPAGRWDAITVVKNGAGESGLFVGDLSAGRAGSLVLHRVAEPKTLTGGALAAKSFKVKYPDGGHRGAALLADPAETRVYIITRDATAAGVFALPGVLGPATNALTRLRTLPFPVRGGAFARDGRVILKTTTDVRILGGIRDDAGQVVKTSASLAGHAFGVSSDGRKVYLSNASSSRPVFRSLALPAVNAATQPDASASPAANDGSPVAYPSKSGMPGGLIGTGALVGLVLLGLLGGVFYVRGRRHSGA